MLTHNAYKECGLGSNFLGSDDELYISDPDTSMSDNMSPSAQAENEDFGLNYSGPKFNDYDAS